MNIVSFSRDLLRGNYILFFEGSDCGLCSGMLEKSLKFFKDVDINFSIISLKDSPTLRGEFRVFASPSMLILKDGRELYRASGFFDFERLGKVLGELNEDIGGSGLSK